MLLLMMGVEVSWVGMRGSGGESVEGGGRRGSKIAGKCGRGEGLRHAVNTLLVRLVLIRGELVVGQWRSR